jgi:tetratricopeptide (TPR) repeat protein
MSKSVVILLFVLLQAFFAIGQMSQIDSLKIKAAQETDPKYKLKYYLDISNEYYRKQLHYDSAFIYLKKIRRAANEIGFTEMEALALNNQAMIYQTLGDKEEAGEYFNKGLLVTKKLNSPIRLALLYNNIGVNYKDLQQYEKSLTYLDSALAISKVISYRRMLGVVYTSIGETNYAINNFKESSIYLEKGIYILDSLKQPSSEADLELAKSYYAEERIELAIIQAEKALLEARQQKAPKSAYQSSRLLSSIYSATGDSKKETLYLKNALAYNDSLSLSSDLNDIELKELEEQHKEHEQQLESLKYEDLLHAIFYVVGAIILILLSVLLFRQIKTTKLTRDIHKVQQDLIQSELDKRNNNNAPTE